MAELSNLELINEAASVINPRQNAEYTIGNVGAALISERGKVYRGACIDVGSSMGFCAEHNAIGAMITAGEYRIRKIVAVWSDGQNLHVLSPCGRCREFMRQIDQANLDTQVVLDPQKAIPLNELLPFADWCQIV